MTALCPLLDLSVSKFSTNYLSFAKCQELWLQLDLQAVRRTFSKHLAFQPYAILLLIYLLSKVGV